MSGAVGALVFVSCIALLYLALMATVANQPRDANVLGEAFRACALAVMPTALAVTGAQFLGLSVQLPFVFVRPETALLGTSFGVFFFVAFAWRLSRPLADERPTPRPEE